MLNSIGNLAPCRIPSTSPSVGRSSLGVGSKVGCTRLKLPSHMKEAANIALTAATDDFGLG